MAGLGQLDEGGASALFTFAQTGNSHHVVARKTRLTAAEVQVEGEKLMSLVTSSEDVKTAASEVVINAKAGWPSD